MFVYLIIGITYGFAAAVQPGPFQTYLISQTLNNGWRRTLPATFAPLISDISAAILALVILNRMPAWTEQLLHFLGGVFVLYLAFGAFKTWKSFEMNKKDTVHTAQQTVWKAVLVNVLNPAAYIGWSLVLGPLLLKGWREVPLNGFALLIAFYGTMIITTVGIIMLFAGARNLGPRVDKKLIVVSALVLAGFGFYQLWLGIFA